MSFGRKHKDAPAETQAKSDAADAVELAEAQAELVEAEAELAALEAEEAAGQPVREFRHDNYPP